MGRATSRSVTATTAGWLSSARPGRCWPRSVKGSARVTLACREEQRSTTPGGSLSQIPQTTRSGSTRSTSRRRRPPISGPSGTRGSSTEHASTRTGSPAMSGLTSTSPIGRTTGSRCGATEYEERGASGMQPPFRGAAHEVFLNMHEHNVHEHSVHERSEGNGAQVMRIESRAVKKLLLLGVGSALMFTMGGIGSAQADTSPNPIHRSTAATVGVNQLVSVGGGRCAGCHRAHTAKAEFLLKQAQPGLCYTCHGGAGSVLDVVDGVDPNLS